MEQKEDVGSKKTEVTTEIKTDIKAETKTETTTKVKTEVKQLNENELKEITKKISIKEGIIANFMDGAGSRYITPYALAIGANNTQIGLLTSIPSLLGNLSQLFTSKIIEKTSRKKIIVWSVFLQALMWIPMLVGGFLFFYRGLDKGTSANLFILFYTLFIIFGAFLSPAWNSLMKDIVTKDKGDYFGKRNKIFGAVSLFVFLAAGILLNYLEGVNLVFIGFSILFGIAFFARLISCKMLTKYYEPKLKLEKGYYFTLGQFIKRIPQSNFGKFTVFIALVSFATAVSSPFFAVYMLKDLQFKYGIWVLITLSGSLSTFLFIQLWGKFSDKFGTLKVLQLTGIFIPLVPFAWFFSPAIAGMGFPILITYLFVVEFFSGIIWAGFNLCAVNFIYDAVTREKFAICIAYYNIFNGVGVFLGATLGGILSSINVSIFGMNPLLFIFALSGVLRMAVYFFMMPMIKEVREVEEYKDGTIKKELRKMLLVPISLPFIRHHTAGQSPDVNTPINAPVGTPIAVPSSGTPASAPV
jgi:MFS family permease